MEEKAKVIDIESKEIPVEEDKRNRFEDFKAWIGRTKDKISVWCGENKEIIVVMAPILVGSVVELVKISAKRQNIKEEEYLKNNYIYDRSNGHYYEIKNIRSSKKRNKNFLEIDRRRNDGEKLYDILDSMKLLK